MPERVGSNPGQDIKDASKSHTPWLAGLRHHPPSDLCAVSGNKYRAVWPARRIINSS